MDNKEDEFVKLVQANKKTIYMVCYMYADKDAIDDYYQEVLINMWQGFARLKTSENLNGWVYRVALNTCISFVRNQKRRPQSVPLSVDVAFYDESQEQSAKIAQLHRLIGKLDVLERALILLWLENISYEEIGEIMGLTTSNVSVKLVRIREKLKKLSNENTK